MDTVTGVIVAADSATAASGAFNVAWLLDYASGAGPGRRTAAVVLAIVAAGTAVQAMSAQAMLWAYGAGDSLDTFFAPAPAMAARLLPLAGMLLISMLIVRRRSL